MVRPADTAIVRRRRRELLIGVVVLAALAALPFPIHDTYTRNLIIITILFAGLAQAWNVLGGYCGQISLGHALYFGVGSYVSAILLTRYGVPPFIGMLAGGGWRRWCRCWSAGHAFVCPGTTTPSPPWWWARSASCCS
jgi:branched-chain amino acid transport system permease protein